MDKLRSPRDQSLQKIFRSMIRKQEASKRTIVLRTSDIIKMRLSPHFKPKKPAEFPSRSSWMKNEREQSPLFAGAPSNRSFLFQIKETELCHLYKESPRPPTHLPNVDPVHSYRSLIYASIWSLPGRGQEKNHLSAANAHSTYLPTTRSLKPVCAL